jgi:hypothetical protein
MMKNIAAVLFLNLSPLAGRGVGRLRRPLKAENAEASFGYVALAIRVRGYRARSDSQHSRQEPLTPTLSPQERGEGARR